MADRPVRAPDIGELQTLVLAADTGSIAAAGKQLGISPAAAAKRIRQLESLAGQALLERSHRGVSLTAEGRAVYRSAEVLLAESARLTSSLVELRGGSDPLRIGGLRSLIHGSEVRRSAERMLSEMEAVFAQVFHGSPDAIVLTDMDEGYVYDANDAFCRLVGRDRAEVLTHTTVELGVWPEDERLAAIRTLREEGAVEELLRTVVI
ncbi:MAG: LysR family transcriptional regulator, partial [Candidatus Limnocylindria bacterium]